MSLGWVEKQTEPNGKQLKNIKKYFPFTEEFISQL